MAKRRTRKQKEKAKHQFLVTWQNEPEKKIDSKPVKGQFKSEPKTKFTKKERVKKAYFMEKEASIASIRHDLIKSLIIASLILASQVMIYLIGS